MQRERTFSQQNQKILLHCNEIAIQFVQPQFLLVTDMSYGESFSGNIEFHDLTKNLYTDGLMRDLNDPSKSYVKKLELINKHGLGTFIWSSKLLKTLFLQFTMSISCAYSIFCAPISAELNLVKFSNPIATQTLSFTVAILLSTINARNIGFRIRKLFAPNENLKSQDSDTAIGMLFNFLTSATPYLINTALEVGFGITISTNFIPLALALFSISQSLTLLFWERTFVLQNIDLSKEVENQESTSIQEKAAKQELQELQNSYKSNFYTYVSPAIEILPIAASLLAILAGSLYISVYSPGPGLEM